MCYIVETGKTFDEAAEDLDAAVKNHGYGVFFIFMTWVPPCAVKAFHSMNSAKYLKSATLLRLRKFCPRTCA